MIILIYLFLAWFCIEEALHPSFLCFLVAINMYLCRFTKAKISYNLGKLQKRARVK